MPRPTGEPTLKIKGLKIWVKHHPAKRNGKDRIWVQVRQDEPKEWRMAASLCYVNGFDIRLEK